MLSLPPAPLLFQAPTLTRTADAVVVQNAAVRLTIDRRTGAYGVGWGGRVAVTDAHGEVTLPDARVLRTTDAARHEVATAKIRDAWGAGVRVTVRHLKPGEPELRQVFWVYADRPEAIVRLDAIGVEGSHRLAPLVSEAKIGLDGTLQALFVPYDNDAYVRYRTDAFDKTSHEVGALYDDASRQGIVVGSIDHDVWKSGVRFGKAGGVTAYGGFVSADSRDSQPHGEVRGREIRSPRFVIGRYADWRDGMERYGDLNAAVQPMLPWKGGVPFGWNSWAAHKTKLSYDDALVATDFFAREMPNFRNEGTAYINLDSFWDNMTRDQRREFVRRAHAAGLKAGIYWTPFVSWGELNSKVAGDEKGRTYRDLALKDAKGEPLPRLDGGYPIDPTHPGTLARIDRQMKEFVEDGYDFLKLDFMTHGSLEARHFDPKVSTGTQAYAIGMRRLLADADPKKIGRPMFLSLSIAPLFPSEFAHSRRISCDAFSNIGASEYLLNSSAYGWWTGGRQYRFNDPDHTVLYQALGEDSTTDAEARTRMTASVISGGMLLESDQVAKPEVQARIKPLLSNPDVLDICRKGRAFRPVDGATGERAGDAFVLNEGDTVYVAAFNFSRKETTTRRVPLARLGLTGRWTVRELWTGARSEVQGELAFELAPTACSLVRLERAR